MTDAFSSQRASNMENVSMFMTSSWVHSRGTYPDKIQVFHQLGSSRDYVTGKWNFFVIDGNEKLFKREKKEQEQS